MTGTTTHRTGSQKPSWISRHRILTLLSVTAAALLLLFVLLEAAYHGQWIDFHRADLRASNSPKTLETDTRPTILVLGDSFSAGRDNWPAALEESLGPGVRVVNSALGGSTVRQMRIIVDDRLRRFNPSLVICQIYIGNDLVDLRHPGAAGQIGPIRRLYWSAIDRGWLLPWFINTRLRQILDRRSPSHRLESSERQRLIAEMEARPFSPAAYSPRSAMLLAASPTLIADQISVTGETAKAWSNYEHELDRLAARCRASGVELLLVVVPHCAQVHPRYADRFRALGAAFPDPNVLIEDESVFVCRLRTMAARSTGVEVLDTLSALRQAEEDGLELFFANDPHLNRTGRRVLAQVIATSLVSR